MPQFKVSTTTSIRETTLITYITASNLQDANEKINSYNVKHPEWDMKLISSFPHDDNSLMLVEYVQNQQYRSTEK